ncbi:Hypothetical_protein [Hexamita inflata]|uniref:Hypothetical_protein n=1 Tax=Hexamita inflata TaxID=28002 RepID=A0AA86PLC7_9EUKA|nr:Hypothetical protein HINF_LOCUS29825 [Hexamita inflata]
MKLLETALELIQMKYYQEALPIYQKVLEMSDDQRIIAITQFIIGFCHLQLSQIDLQQNVNYQQNLALSVQNLSKSFKTIETLTDRGTDLQLVQVYSLYFLSQAYVLDLNQLAYDFACKCFDYIQLFQINFCQLDLYIEMTLFFNKVFSKHGCQQQANQLLLDLYQQIDNKEELLFVPYFIKRQRLTEQQIQHVKTIVSKLIQ